MNFVMDQLGGKGENFTEKGVGVVG